MLAHRFLTTNDANYNIFYQQRHLISLRVKKVLEAANPSPAAFSLSWLVTLLFGAKTYPPITKRDLPLLFVASTGAVLMLGVAGAILDQSSPLFWHAFASDPHGALRPPGLASIRWMVGLKASHALLSGLITDTAFLLKWNFPGRRA